MLQRGKKFACVSDTQVILKENLKEETLNKEEIDGIVKHI